MSTTITITPGEWELISHRLEATDALAGCLVDTFGWDCDDTARRVAAFHAVLCEEFAEVGRLVVYFDKLAEVEREALVDSLEGSTYLIVDDWEDQIALGKVTRGALLSAQRAAASLERKFAAAGRRVSIPRG